MLDVEKVHENMHVAFNTASAVEGSAHKAGNWPQTWPQQIVMVHHGGGQKNREASSTMATQSMVGMQLESKL